MKAGKRYNVPKLHKQNQQSMIGSVKQYLSCKRFFESFGRIKSFQLPGHMLMRNVA